MGSLPFFSLFFFSSHFNVRQSSLQCPCQTDKQRMQRPQVVSLEEKTPTPPETPPHRSSVRWCQVRITLEGQTMWLSQVEGGLLPCGSLSSLQPHTPAQPSWAFTGFGNSVFPFLNILYIFSYVFTSSKHFISCKPLKLIQISLKINQQFAFSCFQQLWT